MPFDAAVFARQLVAWFETAQRALPWRDAPNVGDPYRVLVSEIMLQQTTVAAVAPKYQAFVARFPTVESLAKAPLDDVLSAWQGLGYYSRARNLHAAAQAVMERHGGEFPHDAADIAALPGVGRYTAGAIASIAFDLPAPIVDANVARVLSRVFCIEGDLKSGAAQQKLWHEAAQLVNAAHAQRLAPRAFNPALMELGALVCVPRAPRCELCPVAPMCEAFASGRQNELPHIAPRRAPVSQRDVCLFAQREGRILARQRGHEPGLWWRGMWELPRTTLRADEDAPAALRRLACEELGLEARPVSPLQSVSHAVTHHQIHLECWACDVEGEPSEPARWMSWEELSAVAVPSAMRRVMSWLEQHPGGGEQLRLL